MLTRLITIVGAAMLVTSMALATEVQTPSATEMGSIGAHPDDAKGTSIVAPTPSQKIEWGSIGAHPDDFKAAQPPVPKK